MLGGHSHIIGVSPFPALRPTSDEITTDLSLSESNSNILMVGIDMSTQYGPVASIAGHMAIAVRRGRAGCSSKDEKAGPPSFSVDPRRSGGVDQNDFRVLDPDDLDGGQIRDRRTIPRLDADADIDCAGGGHQIGVSLRVEGERDALSRLDGGPHHPRVRPDRQRVVLGKAARLATIPLTASAVYRPWVI
jgi:hypothetical protein